MMKVRRNLGRGFAAAIAAGAMAAPFAFAQLSSDGGPIRVNADNSSVLERERRVVVVGNVDIVQGNARLRADQVTLFYGERSGDGTAGLGGGFGEIERMRAEGSVFYVTPDLRARGDIGTYDAASETITLTGEEVVLIRGEDVATGCSLVLRVSEGLSQLNGCDGQGVRILIMPEGSSLDQLPPPAE